MTAQRRKAPRLSFDLPEVSHLNVLAGPRRVWRTRTDPAHAWMLSRADSGL
ncbi:hypothetical protein [Defluviimonas sp. WL0075]|uniref:Uncharacterized protein n=1 Tax=Albidovulum sediminicola TaxID=2984331 RepID=A0ABT2Z5J8_9RHOB|nr:hypothetical protein [Defluviimonas sp. WL0075]MCV2866413.1 hypothetical protein [Defluviimonas sp. WL0075]